MLKAIAALFRRFRRKPPQEPVLVTRDEPPTLMLPVKLVARFKQERRRVG
jgi:hypothetical protein